MNDDTIAFLESLGRERIVLTAIWPDKSAGGIQNAQFTDPTEATDWAAKMNGEGWNLYYTVNPARDVTDKLAAGKRPSGEDIERMFAFKMDLDRPDRLKKVDGNEVSATDAEKGAIGGVLKRLCAFLVTNVGGSPTIVDSGNGYNVLVRFDQPPEPTKEFQRACEAFMDFLAAKFNTKTVELDTSVKDLPRVLALPGTVKRKGEATDERPHRVVEMLSWGEPVKTERFVALASKLAGWWNDKAVRRVALAAPRFERFHDEKLAFVGGLIKNPTGLAPDKVLPTVHLLTWLQCEPGWNMDTEEADTEGMVERAFDMDPSDLSMQAIPEEGRKRIYKALDEGIGEEVYEKVKLKAQGPQISGDGETMTVVGAAKEMVRALNLDLIYHSPDDEKQEEDDKYIRSEARRVAREITTAFPHYEPFQDKKRIRVAIGTPVGIIVTEDIVEDDIAGFAWMVESEIRRGLFRDGDRPWRLPGDPRQADVGDLFGDMKRTFQTFYYTSDSKIYTVAAGYVLFTWMAPKVGHTPRLILVGVTGGGKTLFIRVIGHIAYRPVPQSASTEAAMRADMHNWRCTALYDEWTNLTKEKKGFVYETINVGFDRDGSIRRTDNQGAAKITRGYSVGYSPIVIGSRYPMRRPDVINKSVSISCLGALDEELKASGILAGIEYADVDGDALISLSPRLREWFEKLHDIRTRATRWRLEMLNGRVEIKPVELEHLNDTLRANTVFASIAPVVAQFDPDALTDLKAFFKDEKEPTLAEREADMEALIIRALEERVMKCKHEGKEYHVATVKDVAERTRSLYTGGELIKGETPTDIVMGAKRDADFITPELVGRVMNRVLGLRTEKLSRTISPSNDRGVMILSDTFDSIVKRLKRTHIGESAE